MAAAAKTALDNAVKYDVNLPDFNAVFSYLKGRQSEIHTDTVSIYRNIERIGRVLLDNELKVISRYNESPTIYMVNIT